MKKTDIKEGVTYRNKSGTCARRVTAIKQSRGSGIWGVDVEYKTVRGPANGNGVCFLTTFAAWAHSVDGEDTGAPASVAELREENERMRDAIGEAVRQIEYLHEKFQETGSGNAVLARLRDALTTIPKA